MSTTTGNTPPQGNPSIMVDRRELLRSAQRGSSNNNSSSVFRDAMEAASVAAPGFSSLSGSGVVQAALTTGGQALNTTVGMGGTNGLAGGGLGLTRNLTNIPGPPAMPGSSTSLPSTSASSATPDIGQFSNDQAKLTMYVQAMQNESMKWQMIQNVMKANFDTGMNAVRNLKS